jgi:hypothetical protein
METRNLPLTANPISSKRWNPFFKSLTLLPADHKGCAILQPSPTRPTRRHFHGSGTTMTQF